MIVTVTANPSIDRTIALAATLTRGAVLRASGSRREPGGKGINVARAVAAAGDDVCALFPAAADDPLVTELIADGLPHACVPVPTEVRTNLTVTEGDGTTTKINLPGTAWTDATRAQFTELIVSRASGADWVALCGSLPPGVPEDWYVELIVGLRGLDCRIAVDTSDAPLCALAASFDTAAPHLLKPNGHELAQLVNAPSAVDADDLETRAAAGDLTPALDAAATLHERSGAAVLATLGAAGALLVTDEGAWFGTPPPIEPRSTVGAGDSSLAGYLLADTHGLPPEQRLALAISYGAAAAALPGTQPPQPTMVNPSEVTITALTSGAA